jgi:hypothetical protein
LDDDFAADLATDLATALTTTVFTFVAGAAFLTGAVRAGVDFAGAPLAADFGATDLRGGALIPAALSASFFNCALEGKASATPFLAALERR